MAQILARERYRIGRYLLRGAGGHQSAALGARAWSQIDEIVGRAHRLFIVLDHNDGVAQVSQLLQRVEQAAIVALVQPDAGLIEDVEHAHQAAPYLAGETDALPFAA